MPLIDKLLNLPFLKQRSSEFSFDLRKLVVDGGNFDLADPSSSSERKWQLVNGRTEVQRLRGQELREYFQRFLKTGQSESSGLGLQFDLKGLVINGGAKMNIRSRGYVVLPRETLDIRQARWNADLEVVDMPAALVKDLLAPGTPIRTISGHVGERMHIEGDPLQQVRVRGDIEFKQLSIDAPAIFSSTLDRAEGRITFDVEGRPETWRLQRVDFLTSDLRFSLKGEISGAGGSDPRVRLSFSTLSAPVSALRKYLPLKLIGAPSFERLVDSVENGQFEIKKAAVDTTLAELRDLVRGAVPKGISLETELREISAKPPIDNGLPLRALTGRINLANRALALQGFSGGYGDSRFTGLEGTYDLSSANGGNLDLYTRADVNLAELKNQLKEQEVASQLNKFLGSLEELDGRSRVEVSIKRRITEPLQFEGKLTLDNVRARYNEYALNEVQGDLAFSSKDISAEKIRAQVNGSPIQVQLTLKDYDSAGGTFDLGVESSGVRAGVISGLLPDIGSPRDTGIVRGAIRYTGSFANKAQGKFTGTLDLLNVQTRLKPLFQPLRALNGRISIDESGIDFQKLTASLVGFPVTASGRWRYRQNPQLLFEFAAPNLDITYLISQIDPELSEFYATLVADGKIALNKGRIKNFDFSDLTTNATIDHRVWRLTNLSARSAGGSIQGGTTRSAGPTRTGRPRATAARTAIRPPRCSARRTRTSRTCGSAGSGRACASRRSSSAIYGHIGNASDATPPATPVETGEILLRQWGGTVVADYKIAPNKVTVGAELGAASGDDAPGFGNVPSRGPTPYGSVEGAAVAPRQRQHHPELPLQPGLPRGPRPLAPRPRPGHGRDVREADAPLGRPAGPRRSTRGRSTRAPCSPQSTPSAKVT